MVAEQSTIKKIRIDNTDIFLEDFEPGKGKITVSDTYGHNYSYFWGAMGRPLAEFICVINESYFASNLIGLRSCYVMDVRRTFAAIRKFIVKELDLPYYKHMEFQKNLREVLNTFQRECEERPTNDFFVSAWHCSFIESLNYYEIEDWRDREKVKNEFDNICEQWNFIVEKESPEYLWLATLHKKLKKLLSKPKK